MSQTPHAHPTDLNTAKQLGLLPEEFQHIVEALGRVPNFTELCAFSGMWSEHCSYKNSIKWLKTLPRTGPDMLAEAGKENAGLVDIGDGLACAFKIESHNHPSAIEPYQGAATGVGGINRDIFTMGARPIAQLNALFFSHPSEAKCQWLMRGVVKGIGDYGNAFGVPTVAGQVFFDESFRQNPLVNAMSAGIVEHHKVMSAIATGVGNPVYIVGSATGKDGIHGASFASGDITESSADNLPAVQVGDPFQEKLLLEATLELIDSGAAVGIQDMGAAGIICSTSEMSEKGGHGMDIHLDRVPTRGGEMQPYELLLSESQERMLVVVHRGREKEVETIFERWDLQCACIGEVTGEDRLRFFMHGTLEADLPASLLVLGGGAPVYERAYSEPAYIKAAKQFSLSKVPQPKNLKEAALKLHKQPNLVSRTWVTRQYDSTIGTANLSANKPSDAAIIWVKGTQKALALTVDVNPRYVQADPKKGTMIAVAEAARNIACSGATPKAITNCLNFGNPYQPEAYWQFVHAVKGMGEACKAFGTPVTGGNVSFYNQFTKGDQTIPVAPSPSIGMLGLLHDLKHHTSLAFQKPGEAIFLLGEITNDIASSEYLRCFYPDMLSPAPYFVLEKEMALCALIQQAIAQGLVASAHDVSEGGLWQCLLESAYPNMLGFDAYLDDSFRPDAFLFGEGQGRILISADPEHEESLLDLAAEAGVPLTLIGHTLPKKIRVEGEDWGAIEDWHKIYTQSLEQYLQVTQ